MAPGSREDLDGIRAHLRVIPEGLAAAPYLRPDPITQAVSRIARLPGVHASLPDRRIGASEATGGPRPLRAAVAEL